MEVGRGYGVGVNRVLGGCFFLLHIGGGGVGIGEGGFSVSLMERFFSFLTFHSSKSLVYVVPFQFQFSMILSPKKKTRTIKKFRYISFTSFLCNLFFKIIYLQLPVIL